MKSEVEPAGLSVLVDTDFTSLSGLLWAQPSTQRTVHTEPAHQALLPTFGPEGDLRIATTKLRLTQTVLGNLMWLTL